MAVALAAPIGIPAGIVATRRGVSRLRPLLDAVFSLAQSIPPVAAIALALADRIAVMAEGRLAAEGTPAAVLGPGASEPVRRMVRAGTLAFHRLAALDAESAAEDGTAPGAPLLPAGARLGDALLLMLEHGSDRLALAGAPPRHLTMAAILGLSAQ